MKIPFDVDINYFLCIKEEKNYPQYNTKEEMKIKNVRSNAKAILQSSQKCSVMHLPSKPFSYVIRDILYEFRKIFVCDS